MLREILIVQKAVQSATSCNTVLVGDDTYLLVLLCYHASLQSHELFFCHGPKKNTKQLRIWNIKAVKQRLGPDICKHILFLNAVPGYDTTSRLHRIGKGASLKIYQTNNVFRKQTKVMHTHSASTRDVTCAVERALVILYNGRSTEHPGLHPASTVPGAGRIKCNSSSSTYPTTNVRSSQISQYACVPASRRREGIC